MAAVKPPKSGQLSWRSFLSRVPGARQGESSPEESVRPSGRIAARKAQKRRIADNWFAWGLELVALALPVFLTVFVNYFYTEHLNWALIAAASSKGDYLIPTLILCVDVTRRWYREVKGELILTSSRDKRYKIPIFVRSIVITISGLAAGFCLVTQSLAASGHISNTSGKVINIITVWCLVAAVPFGTAGVYMSNIEVMADEVR